MNKFKLFKPFNTFGTIGTLERLEPMNLWQAQAHRRRLGGLILRLRQSANNSD